MIIPYNPILEHNNSFYNIQKHLSDDKKIFPGFFMPNGNIALVMGAHMDGNLSANLFKMEKLILTHSKEISIAELNRLKSEYLEMLKKLGTMDTDTILKLLRMFNFKLEDMYMDKDIFEYKIVQSLKDYLMSLINLINYFLYKLNNTNNFKNGLANYLKKDNDPVDFYVQVVGFSKIEKLSEKTITTANANYLETFFNYLIMDWQVRKYNKQFIDDECFEDDNVFFRNENIEDEIEKIRKKVPLDQRQNYFR